MRDIDALAKVARATWCGNPMLEGAVPEWESLAPQSKQVWIDLVEAVLKELRPSPPIKAVNFVINEDYI